MPENSLPSPIARLETPRNTYLIANAWVQQEMPGAKVVLASLIGRNAYALVKAPENRPIFARYDSNDGLKILNIQDWVQSRGTGASADAGSVALLLDPTAWRDPEYEPYFQALESVVGHAACGWDKKTVAYRMAYFCMREFQSAATSGFIDRNSDALSRRMALDIIAMGHIVRLATNRELPSRAGLAELRSQMHNKPFEIIENEVHLLRNGPYGSLPHIDAPDSPPDEAAALLHRKALPESYKALQRAAVRVGLVPAQTSPKRKSALLPSAEFRL